MTASTTALLVYKISDGVQWAAAVKVGAFTGSSDDRRDGYIHMSTGAQVLETARRYFTNQPDLVLAAFDPSKLGETLRWEPSRGGDLFPHLYAALPTANALWVRSLTLDASGVPIIPEGLI